MMNKLQWYINRLSLMSLMEIGHRFKEEIKKKYERLFKRDIFPEIVFRENKIFWYFQLQDRNKIFSFLEKKYMWNEDKAQELLAHKFSFFSLNLI